MDKIDNSLMVRCEKCGHFFNEREAKPLEKDELKNYKDDIEFWGHCPHCGKVLHLARLNSVSDIFDTFKDENPTWREYLTDSTYFEIADWFASEFNYDFDDEKGYPEQVTEFASCVWKEICPQAYESKEYVRVEKEFYDDLMSLLKSSSDEGNCFANLILKKYNIKK